ncbi:MAG TPA: hypothetical protein VH413_20655 [Verrucomicrobiae bacterium]|nr:hypothetical protein [Verrucomicrobiae bacterium]
MLQHLYLRLFARSFESISVDVGAAPDATSTMPLLGAALAGLALVRRKFKA